MSLRGIEFFVEWPMYGVGIGKCLLHESDCCGCIVHGAVLELSTGVDMHYAWMATTTVTLSLFLWQ